MRNTVLGNHIPPIPVAVFTDPVALGEGLAEVILEGIQQAAREGRRYVLGCPGGRSPMPTYQALGRRVAGSPEDLSQVTLVMMDEYLLGSPEAGFVNCPGDAHYSCHRAAREEIAGVINAGLEEGKRIPEGQVWFPEPNDPEAYDERVRAAGGVDLFIVATGAGDGHVAFNPPGTPAEAGSRLIKIAETTRRDNLLTFPEFGDIAAVPKYGVSVGLGTIAGLSREVVLIAWGEGKQQALRRLAGYEDFDPQWPASILYRCRGARVMGDEAAAGGLQ